MNLEEKPIAIMDPKAQAGQTRRLTINTTSRRISDWQSDLSPFKLGPFRLWDGRVPVSYFQMFVGRDPDYRCEAHFVKHIFQVERLRRQDEANVLAFDQISCRDFAGSHQAPTLIARMQEFIGKAVGAFRGGL